MARRILVVDDSRVQRKILASQIARSGHRVTEAGSGEEALEICRREAPDVVISDWMMPGMSGLDFCKALRELEFDGYIYFILLTSKTETAEVALGLDIGADDFLTKPVSGDELRARIAAGERILRVERELKDKNRLLKTTLDQLQSLYDSIDRDLIEARKLQQSLVRERFRSFGNADVTLLLRPSGHVGGDLVGFFQISASRIGVFSIDVSGHGITSALMTARLAGFMSGNSPEQNLALLQTGAGYGARPPDELAGLLNRIVLSEMKTETYFTLAYAEVDLATGQVSMVQAGHPHPIVQRASGKVEFLGRGGFPIGLVDDARYEVIKVQLDAGDRLFLMSDGITEAPDPDGRELGAEGLAGLMHQCRGRQGDAFMQSLMMQLDAFSGGEFPDDVSAALIEFRGRP
ncbi:SpoIIE family protein phosphatase [Defluviimonas sp. WL0002]|uniref:SpoIIE family protein phosphatase n=1 Tax=Albidovulum marisflavi TaxID=2984159 RepID=A0ABT2Z8P8_9RHOB|nr:SpoIIE family protein phosphatase [Defluviimonas sp. WL0002]MCV2867397.1 SpoIIE family protein phosphatase [Defluviimonas sp. WL0002]